MHSCCSVPVELITEDKHKTDDTCCLVTEKTSAPSTAACPVSKTLSRKVQQRTLKHLAKPERLEFLENVQYYYCAEPTCGVVYFSNDAVPYFTKDEVRVKVFHKESSDDVNICYCYDWTRGRIKQQIHDTGKSTAAFEIAQEVKAGNCECDIKNPKGECCLGDVNAMVKELFRLFPL